MSVARSQPSPGLRRAKSIVWCRSQISAKSSRQCLDHLIQQDRIAPARLISKAALASDVAAGNASTRFNVGAKVATEPGERTPSRADVHQLLEGGSSA